MRSLALFAALLATAAPAIAAETEDAMIIVTGKGLKDLPGDAALSLVVIGRDRILSTGSNRLESVLADIAGQQQFRRSDSRSANATSQGITLRGLGGNASSRALLMLDGVPQADPFGGWVAFPAYATGRLDRIRVTRGGGSGYWGPGALAGTIELESAGPATLTPFVGNIAYGSRESLDAQASLALKRDGGFAVLSGAYGRGDGFIPIVARSRGPADRAAPYEQASANIRAVVQIAPDTEAQVTATAFTDSRERGTAFSRNTSEGVDAALRLVGRGKWGWQALAYVQNRNFTSDFASVNATRTAATQTLAQFNTPATGWGGRLELAPPVGDGITLRVGADTRQLKGATNELFTYVNAAPTRQREAGGETGNSGLFADASIEAGLVTASLSARIDWWQIRDGRLLETTIATAAPFTTLRFADRSGREFTGRAGVAIKAADWITLRSAAYRGWRLPTLNELYRPFRVGPDATAANALLKPERVTGVDAGLTLKPAAGIEIGITGFWNRMDDSIANVTLGSGPGNFPGVGFVAAGGFYRQRQNLDALEVWGWEIDGRARLGQFGLSASWSHVDPSIRSSGAAAALNDLAPAQTPRDQFSGTIDYAGKRFTASATLRHIASQFEDDQNSRSLGAATMVDALLLVPVIKGLSIEGRVENLFDAEVQAALSGTGVIERALPRTVWLGARVSF
ncbi:TonB-dependent receptor [Sandarakinorhabdus cyanobacteriorum]|uniref:TonB-dependent receptor n=1 Tax=Sandarakinorhabdus cyanobacteriorum TaxID=1981098 RepID=A0A255Y979_9SPHN|nr:TonB-dependent receptor [Sandarakinorhabdus cyanobacteriorum]OYQ25731.1 TonB-dependent receptor [Sandarakinorhabdus cyanobacteriorum]